MFLCCRAAVTMIFSATADFSLLKHLFKNCMKPAASLKSNSANLLLVPQMKGMK